MTFKELLEKNKDKRLIYAKIDSKNAFEETVSFAIFSKAKFKYRFLSFSYDGRTWSDVDPIFTSAG